MRFSSVLLWMTGWNCKKPKTRVGKVWRGIKYAASVFACLYVLLQFFPQVIFAHSLEAGGIRLYSTSPIPSKPGRFWRRFAPKWLPASCTCPSRKPRRPFQFKDLRSLPPRPPEALLATIPSAGHPVSPVTPAIVSAFPSATVTSL